MTSWTCLVKIFQDSKDNPYIGHYQFLTNEFNIRLMSILSDVLYIFSRYQKQLQSDDLHIISMDEKTNNFIKKIETLKLNPLLGGWVETLNKEIKVQQDGTFTLNNISLISKKPPRGNKYHQFVTHQRNISSINQEILCSLQEFLTQRFSIDQELLSIVKPFVQLLPNANLKDVHTLIGEDLSLRDLSLEYDELLNISNIYELRKMHLNQIVSKLSTSTIHFKNITILLARILAAKLHSADVERLIIASNLLKSPMRSRMSLETENMYLFINYNLPPLYDWNPKEAVHIWLTKKKHRVIMRIKGKKQNYFNGLFKEADDRHIYDNLGSDDDHDDVKNKKKIVI